MTDHPVATSAPAIGVPIPLGYFTCKRRIDTLKRFQNLIRHRERWADEMRFACPIEELIPANIPTEDQHIVIEHEINKMMIPVYDILHQAHVATIVVSRPRPSQVPIDKEHEYYYDIIRNYYDFPLNSRESTFDAMMRVLNQGIGVYESRTNPAFWDLLNPLYWIAMLVRSPIWIMQRAGIAAGERFYTALIRYLALGAFALLVVHYGIATWKEIARLILKEP